MTTATLTEEKYKFYKSLFYGDLERMVRDLKLTAKKHASVDCDKARDRIALYNSICKRAEEEKVTNDTLNLIKEQIGLELILCPDFTGLNRKPIGTYFNVVLDERTSESNDYIELERLANNGRLLKVEANGLKRVAIFPNISNL